MMGFWIFKPCKKVCCDSSEEYAISIFKVNEFGSGDCCSISIHLNQIQSPHIWRQHVPLNFVKTYYTLCTLIPWLYEQHLAWKPDTLNSKFDSNCRVNAVIKECKILINRLPDDTMILTCDLLQCHHSDWG